MVLVPKQAFVAGHAVVLVPAQLAFADEGDLFAVGFTGLEVVVDQLPLHLAGQLGVEGVGLAPAEHLFVMVQIIFNGGR
jgi:hypothetical protein